MNPTAKRRKKKNPSFPKTIHNSRPWNKTSKIELSEERENASWQMTSRTKATMRSREVSTSQQSIIIQRRLSTKKTTLHYIPTGHLHVSSWRSLGRPSTTAHAYLNIVKFLITAIPKTKKHKTSATKP